MRWLWLRAALGQTCGQTCDLMCGASQVVNSKRFAKEISGLKMKLYEHEAGSVAGPHAVVPPDS